MRPVQGYYVGQMFERIGSGALVVVGQVRDEDDPKGLGRGFGESAVGMPWPEHLESWQRYRPHERPAVVEYWAQPFDVWILCRALPHLGDAVWRELPEP